MNLKFPFPEEVRNLYLYTYSCCLCGSNQMLELRHILGRISDSAFNSAVVCHECHSKMGHSTEEHQRVFNKSVVVLHEIGFNPEQKDIDFLIKYQKEMISDETYFWLERLVHK